jgi:hypothetical protein
MITQQQIRLTKLALALSIALSARRPSHRTPPRPSAAAFRVRTVRRQPARGAIVHTESGSVSNVTTDAEGRYVARGLRTWRSVHDHYHQERRVRESVKAST